LNGRWIALRRDVNEIAEGLHWRDGGRDRRSGLLASLRVSVDRVRKIGRYVGAGAVPAGCIAFGRSCS